MARGARHEKRSGTRVSRTRAPSVSTSSRCASQVAGQRSTSACAGRPGSVNASTVGPAPETIAAHAVARAGRRRGRATPASPDGGTPGAGSRASHGAGAPADRPGRRRAAPYAPHRPPRRRAGPRPAAAPARARSTAGRAARTRRRRSAGRRRTARRRSRRRLGPEITNPPKNAGATLSGWPSISAASWKTAWSSSSSRPPATSPRARDSPATMAADDEPRPRAWGTTFVQARRRPGGSRVHRRERRPHRADDEVRLVAAGRCRIRRRRPRRPDPTRSPRPRARRAARAPDPASRSRARGSRRWRGRTPGPGRRRR